jgi:hypothetical protein
MVADDDMQQVYATGSRDARYHRIMQRFVGTKKKAATYAGGA